MLDNAIAKSVSRFGKEFSIPTFKDLIKLTDKINIPSQYKAFITISDILNWCQSPAGVDQLLCSCGKIKIGEIETLGTEYSRYVLVQELVGRFMGYGEPQTESEKLLSEVSPEETPVPLAETSQSGS